MTDSKSTCCGKPVSVFSGDEGTNHWICGACGKACDVVTDSKTARELANRIDCMDPYTTDMADVIEQAILQYASDKDKIIAELEAEVIGLKTWSETLKDSIRLKDGLWEQRLGELAFLKSSLAEKEAELARIQRLPTLKWAEASADIMLEFASTARGGDKEAAQKMLAAFDKVKTYVNQLEAHITYRERELDRHIFSSRVCIEGRDSQLASLRQEIADRADTEQSLTIELDKVCEQHAQLQLENGVMRSALERINEYCNDPSCGSVSKHALSPSTKSSLMEKVHSLLNALKPFEQRIDGWRKHLKKGSITQPIPKEWLEVEFALTEVKKEMGA